MNELQAFFSQPANLLGTTIVAAVVSAAVNFIFRLTETRHKLEAEYRYEQRKKLRDLVAEYQGRLLSHGNSLNYRMWNLYQNQSEGWLSVSGAPTKENYYFLSFVYRFLNFCSLLREFENAAIVIDSRIGTTVDLQISNLVSSLRWCLTDVALFEGLEYDHSAAHDHFYSDHLRQLCDDHRGDGGESLSFERFCDIALTDAEPQAALGFFDGLSKFEDRLRWDRLVAFHLLLLDLINVIGHSVHKTSQRKINKVASEINNRAVLENFMAWLPRHEVPLKYRAQLWAAKHCAKNA